MPPNTEVRLRSKGIDCGTTWPFGVIHIWQRELNSEKVVIESDAIMKKLLFCIHGSTTDF